MAENIPYVRFSTVGMPMRNEIESVQGVHYVFSFLNTHFNPSTSESSTWYNTEINKRIEVSGCTGMSDVIMYDIINGRWRIVYKVSIQDFYNMIQGNNVRNDEQNIIMKNVLSFLYKLETANFIYSADR